MLVLNRTKSQNSIQTNFWKSQNSSNSFSAIQYDWSCSSMPDGMPSDRPPRWSSWFSNAHEHGMSGGNFHARRDYLLGVCIEVNLGLNSIDDQLGMILICGWNSTTRLGLEGKTRFPEARSQPLCPYRHCNNILTLNSRYAHSCRWPH